MAKRPITPPAPLQPTHDIAPFSCGRHEALDVWLRDRALTSEGLSPRTYVVCDGDAPDRVVGYYTITTAMEQRAALPTARLRRGMPEQVPLLLIARLAIDETQQGRGLGSDLLADALRRCLAVAAIAGVRGLIVHAIDDDAARFYERHGFVRSALGEFTLILPIETLRSAID